MAFHNNPRIVTAWVAFKYVTDAVSDAPRN